MSRGAAAAHLQRRPDLMNRVSRLLQPGADLPSDAYYCILGAPNSGKTHIVRKACEEVRAVGAHRAWASSQSVTYWITQEGAELASIAFGVS